MRDRGIFQRFRNPQPATPPSGLRRGRALFHVALVLGLIVTVLAGFLIPLLRPAGEGARLAHRVYRNTKIPDPPRLARTTYVYDRNGNLLTTLSGAIDRRPVRFADIPRRLRQAVIAAEDKDFYEEGGVSFEAILRALVANLSAGEIVQGGSTITQQYVKTLFTGGEQTADRKIREAIIAQKLSKRQGKNEILTRYLNQVYFGRSAYGVQAAAQRFFGIDIRDLDLAQSATLAGLIAAPSRFDPVEHPWAAKIRRNYVLRQMVDEGYVRPATARAIARREVVVNPPQPIVPAQYFLSYVRKDMQKRFGEYATFHGGLHVTTSLDMRLQRAARHAVDSHLALPTDPSASLVAIDPATGEVLAMVGGRSHERVKFNLATQARRSTGSAFKAFTLAAAVEQGISPESRWRGPSQLLIKADRCRYENPETGRLEAWDVSNYAEEGAGDMDLFGATALSVNTIFAQLALTVGPDNVAEMAERLGVRSPLAGVCSITLGTQGATPLDMTAAYATLAARGMQREPHGITEVTGSSGRLIAAPDGNPEPVVSREVADIVTNALRGVVEHGTGTAANIGRPVAGKTGTAENYKDAWFCGYVPQLVSCVWVGYAEGEVELHNIRDSATGIMYPNIYGGSIPAAIWHDFMSAALARVPVKDFAPLPDISGYDRVPRGSIGDSFRYGEEGVRSIADQIRELIDAGLRELAEAMFGADVVRDYVGGGRGRGDESD